LFSDFNDESDPEIFDVVVEGFPWGLPNTDLIRMVWYSIPASLVTFAALQLAEQTTLFFEFNDSDEFGFYFLALADGVSPKLAHDMFMRELFRSNGETFDTAVSGGSPPNEVSSAFPRSTLLDCFLMVADRAEQYGEFWEELLEMIAKNSKRLADTEFDVSTEDGRRNALDAYLTTVVS
jgi:hypothetical protein